MKLSKKILMTTAACIACTISGVSADASEPSVSTHTFTQTQDIEGAKEINFSEFDINHDGLYAKSEVGEKLYYAFDLDGNEVIDNKEWDTRSVYTISPMEQETFRFVDYNSDGYTDLTTYTYDQFYKESALILFDKNKDGLTPAEFIAVGFQELDDDDNNIISLEEWKEAYTEMTKPKNAEQERYN